MDEKESLSNDEIELVKLRRIAAAADIIVKNDWTYIYINEDEAKIALKHLINEYNNWIENNG